MHRLRFAILGAVAALALGTGTAVAMQHSAGGETNSDSHGDAVASAARTCPHGAEGVHGQCVSAAASTEGQDNQTESSDAAQAAKVKACKAAGTGYLPMRTCVGGGASSSGA